MTLTRGDHPRFPLGVPDTLQPDLAAWPRTSKADIDPRVLRRPLTSLPAVGPRTAARLAALQVHNVEDLLLHVPFRHEPPAAIIPVRALVDGQEATVRGRVRAVSSRPTRRRSLKVLEALVEDATGTVKAVWYNQDYLKEAFSRHPEVLVRGVLTRRGGFTSFVVKRHEILGAGEEGLHTLGLVPVYPASGDLSVRLIRSLLSKAAPQARHLVDPLPSELLARFCYPRKAEALLAYHFPGSLGEAGQARDRLAFEELLLLQLALLSRRREQESGRVSRPLKPPAELSRRFLEGLPYDPTQAQRRVIAEIEGDLGLGRPMRRLLQGDVGSGKTMVATYALVRAVESGGQGVLMAPTEVLADQHAARLADQLGSLGIEVGLLKGNQPAAERRWLLARLSSGELRCVVGTHALIAGGVGFADLRVVVIDEQHRFGVRQRDSLAGAAEAGSALSSKPSEPAAGGDAGTPQAAYWPHTLHLTATPIPRTLSLTLYGDLDLSVIDEMPAGRQPVKTRMVFTQQEPRMWAFVRGELDKGRQVYVVCPLIEESPSLDAASAVTVFEQLRAGELQGYQVRLLHGQLAPGEKQAAMAAFASGEAHVLVSTTVIEVGIDVANATVMVILGARRFGLSQLHQLRGRVGRGSAASFCFLQAGHGDAESLERLRLFARTNDGFALAEADLQARGEGQLFGERQSGLSDLRVARLLRDARLLERARSEGAAILERDPSLQGPLYRLLGEATARRFGDRSAWLDRA